MGLRVNTNITAMTAQRNLTLADARLFRSVQRLSSGLRINSAADDPAGLVISEQLRAQISGLNAAIVNTERAVNLIQTMEGALNEVNSLLIGMRELALDAANSGINNETSLAADQAEIANAIQTITRISDTSTFSIQTLLDGTFENEVSLTSLNTIGLTNMSNSTLQTGSYTISVSNITAASATITSDPFGLLDNVELGGIVVPATGDPDGLAGGSHSIVVSEATGAYVTSSSEAVLDGSSTVTDLTTITITSSAASDVVTFEGTDLNSVADIVAEINAEVGDEFIAVNNGDGTYSIGINSNSTAVGAGEVLTVAVSGGAEQEFGFAAASVTSANGQNVGVQLDDGDMTYLTTTAVATDFVVSDANGGSLTLALETAFSTWNVIDGGTLNVDVVQAGYDLQLGSGPKVAFTSGETKTLSAGEDFQGNPIGTLDISFGFFNVPTADSSVTISVIDNSIQFQVGPNANETVRISARDISADKLSLGLITQSNFVSLESIDVTTVQGANDSILLIDRAIDEVTGLRAKLGAFQQNTLETNLRSLRIAQENLSASESTIRDVDISIEITEFTRNQILLSAGVSVLAQANAIPQTVLQLLG